MTERTKDQSGERSAEHNKELEDTRAERVNEIERNLETAAEHAGEQNTEKLQETAEKLADTEKKKGEKKVSPAEKRKDSPLPNTKAGKKAAFNATMKDARAQMSAPSRTFSKIIHNRPVEKTSEVIGATVARPNALLAGSVAAFILTLAVYLVARYYGYPLTGSESIAAFIIGWLLGILFDYFRVMVTGKKA